jgi:hypothetical protein
LPLSQSVATERTKENKLNVHISREYSFLSGTSLFEGSVLGTSKETEYGLAD